MERRTVGGRYILSVSRVSWVPQVPRVPQTAFLALYQLLFDIFLFGPIKNVALDAVPNLFV